ncbi:PREDICTED: uncharacterized protein LOC108558179 isoform X3 [Nicrophorus vespilloides]|uniref:Uncharacterized protein LOC108558179 isoform X3 n=1 Tax=Nicrophorus vespilloides TaxID=110193 RepID=A0ABM1M7E8_NICVS|nr:PREDICTED: uncharacterized protein LOC108558179 isoform X3 [Nicrophorus vespilloides]
MSTAVSGGHHSGAGSLSLMSCVRESSPPQDAAPEYETEKNVSSKRKFWNPRKWFKRKSTKVTEEAVIENNTSIVIGGGSTEALETTLRSRSTSELSISEEQTRRRSTGGGGGTPMHPGLSVSHDSVFHSPQSGSDLELDGAQSSSSLSISHQPTQQNIRLQTELNERLRLRRTRGDTSEDDEGLPRSPCNSPTAADGHHLDKSKDHPTKSHSTCSDGSLLSMGSSEMDEDLSIGGGQHSRHSSKLSLHEKRTPEDEVVSEWGPNQSASAAPLNHSAAHHKVAVRPKRTHGAPRRRRVAGPVLPTTPEVNEDSSVRSISPEGGNSTRAGPGLDGNKLSRSRSNAGVVRSHDALEEEDCADGKKSEGSFFGRIFPRRSGKKKKAKEQKEDKKEAVKEEAKKVEVSCEPFEKNTIVVDGNLAIRPNALRSGPASRQRVQPIEIPVAAAADIQEETSSPLHAELESHFKSKRVTPNQQESPVPLSVSPPASAAITSKVPWSQESRQYTKFTSTKYSESVQESKTKVRIAGLSSLQQRVLSLNEDDAENSFKSLTNLPTDNEKPAKPLAKSHSFKATKTSYQQQAQITLNLRSEDKESLIFKSISLDSVQNERVVESVNEAKVEVTESNDITITGPSHNKAIVNICAAPEVKEQPQQQISVTKIHLKPSTEEIVLEKPRKFSNDSIELEDEDVKRFSNEHVEIVVKKEATPVVTITPMPTSRYKKHTESMKRALVVSEKPVLKVKSNSFEKPSEPKTPEETTKSQENLCSDYSQVIRRKSMIKPKHDEEPELMKVFARRSLKLKDVDSEAISQQVNQMVQENSESKTSRDSDKENCSDSSPLEERKKLSDSVEVTFRKHQHTNNNKNSSTPIYQRTVSLHQPSVKTSDAKQILKQISAVERPKTETWISSTNNNNNNNGGGKMELKEQIDSSEIIANISEKKSDIITEFNVIPKNFNQRKAEWEKRAKEGIRKAVP